jgi:hypothetical protein
MTEPEHDPLLWILLQLQKWIESTQSESFWHTIVEHEREAESLHDLTKHALVWLELRGREEEASEIDESLSEFMDAVWEFGESTKLEYPPDSLRCRESREDMVEACNRLAGRVEDAASELPGAVWEGFEDG